MRDPTRIHRILETLEKLWNEHSDQRLGQLLENYIFTDGKRGDKTSCLLFFQEDTDTEIKLERALRHGKL